MLPSRCNLVDKAGFRLRRPPPVWGLVASICLGVYDKAFKLFFKRQNWLQERNLTSIISKMKQHTFHLAVLNRGESMLRNVSICPKSMVALTIAWVKLYSFLTSKKQPRALESMTNCFQLEPLLTKVAAFPNTQRQYLHTKPRKQNMNMVIHHLFIQKQLWDKNRQL